MNNIQIKHIIIVLLIAVTLQGNAQIESPYKLNKFKDGAWVAGSLGMSAFGMYLFSEKEGLTERELANLDKNDRWEIDRWAAGNYSESANKISDIPFFISFATPFLFAINKDTRGLSGELGIMYLESLGTTAALFTLTAGLVDKGRPYVYSEEAPLKKRLSGSGLRSFYSGHVGASATATFFAAQVFSDLYPDSKAKSFVWAGAATIPAVVGYFRIKSGNHFLTDTLIGYVMGAASGILVPRIHRKKDSKLKFNAGIGFDQTNIGLSYKF